MGSPRFESRKVHLGLNTDCTPLNVHFVVDRWRYSKAFEEPLQRPKSYMGHAIMITKERVINVACRVIESRLGAYRSLRKIVEITPAVTVANHGTVEGGVVGILDVAAARVEDNSERRITQVCNGNQRLG
jgi:hypothetical protein